MPIKRALKKVKKVIDRENEKGARVSVIEDLFYDFNKSRTQVYWFNFIRGIFFGAGSIIGGTVVIALIVWLLSLLGFIFPPLQDFFQGVGGTLESTQK